jgi:hypothetical protein
MGLGMGQHFGISFYDRKISKMEIPTLHPWPKQQFNTLRVSAMAISSNIFLGSSTQNPRDSARGQKSGFFQFFLKKKLMPEETGFQPRFQQSTNIFYWGASRQKYSDHQGKVASCIFSSVNCNFRTFSFDAKIIHQRR